MEDYPDGYFPPTEEELAEEKKALRRESRPPAPPKRLSKDQRIAAMMVSQGASNKEIAAKLKRSVVSIQGWRRMDIFIECVENELEHTLDETRRELSAQYCDSAREAFEVLREQLGKEAYVAQNAARMIIDKFYALADKTDATSVVVQFVNMPVLGEATREIRPAEEINIVGLLKPTE